YFNQYLPLRGRPSWRILSSASNALLSREDFTYEVIEPQPGIEEVHLTGHRERTYENGIAARDESYRWEYGIHGAPTVSTHCRGAHFTTTLAVQFHDTSSWFINRIDEVRTIAGVAPPQGRHTEKLLDWYRYTYHANGQQLLRRERMLCENAEVCSCTFDAAQP